MVAYIMMAIIAYLIGSINFSVIITKKMAGFFGEKPQAWIHGPVFRTLFDSMKDYKKFSKTNEIEKIEKDITDFLDVIYSIYGKYSGNELEKLTHSELPWIKARNGLKPYEFSQNTISDEDIMKCYGG